MVNINTFGTNCRKGIDNRYKMEYNNKKHMNNRSYVRLSKGTTEYENGIFG